MENNLNIYTRLPYSTVVVPDVTTDGELCYMAHHPELEGCMTHGDTPEEALRNLDEARRLYISALIDDGLEVPLPQGVKTNWEIVGPRTEQGESVDLFPTKTPTDFVHVV